MSVSSRQIGVAAPPASQTPQMRTVLSEFCESFETALRPLLAPVQETAQAVAAAPEDLSARRVLPALRDLHHQMETLVDKVAAQQAYVLIFGPLKSGKSTFMNALSSAYVSEVTSLPAYPCMVYVQHADEPGFVVTHYDGRITTLERREALRQVIADGHRALTRRIREVEDSGETFDPAVHMPEAIRRIDVKIAIDDLAQSGAVLVDTPGLYTRMKFGYDRMTRDFRNAAACAIFIVKTDNLFLEQVFDEFGELLELFSRIFLVVNVDSTKKDLLPDGTLTPSLEQTKPWEVIEAFEQLSMTTPLKKAVEEGRLEIYPVDLLRSASRRIRGHANVEADADGGPEFEAAAAAAPSGQADFGDVLGDLTEFLNSNEYLKAFLDDSLRRSRTLVDELEVTLQDDTMQQLGRDVTTLQETCEKTRAKAETAQRLRQIQWRDHVQGLTPSLLERVGELAAQVKADAAGPIETAIERWFENSNSLHQLLEEELHPIFASTHGRLIRETEDTIKRRASEDLAGLANTEELLSDLANVGIGIRATAEAALHQLKARAAAPSAHPRLASDIPVRRSIADWILLRSGAKVRQRLFGPADQPGEEIPAAVKARLIGERGREAIRETLMARLESVLDQAARGMPDQLVRGYAERFEQDLQTQLERIETRAGQRLEELEQRLHDVRAAHDSVHDLAGKLVSFGLSVDMLIEQFGQTEPAALTENAV